MFTNYLNNGGFFSVYMIKEFQNTSIATCPKQLNATLNTYNLPEQLAKTLLAAIYIKNLLLFEQLYLKNGKVNKNLISFILSFRE